MSAHTPGPWTLIQQSPPSIIKPGACDICVMSGAASNEGVMADARLIAAAPDLLEALQAIVALDDGDSPDLWHFEDEFNKARAAITRATQGS